MPHRKNDGVHDETGNRVRRARGGASSVRETPFSATYDAGNRMLTFNTDTLAYDAAGNLVRRTGTCGTTTYTWDARNQLTQIQGFTPDCTPVTGAFIYDDRGRRIEKTVNGRSVRYLYDGPQVIAEFAGAMIDTTYLTGLEIDEVLARYGAQSERMLLADALGSVLALTDPQGNPTTTYAYSAYGKTEPAGAPSENPVQNKPKGSDSIERTQSSPAVSCDEGEFQSSLTLLVAWMETPQQTVTYGYDNTGNLTTIAQGSDTVTIQYDELNRRKQLSYPNGVVANYTYDDAGRLTNISYQKGATPIEQLAYEYDPNGNIVRRVRLAGESKQESAKEATYDPQTNRLLTLNGETFTYDDAGNLTQRTGTCGTTTYSWNSKHQLTAINGFKPDCSPMTASFRYDAMGRRIERTIDGQTTQYLYDGLDVIAEFGQLTAQYLRTDNIDEAIARYTQSGERYYLTDILGSTVVLTDRQGNPKTTYSYSPYGETARIGEPSDNPVQYTGRENDGTGLYYYRARYYAAEMGRFVTSDPIGLDGGLNTYAYVENNPFRFVDPHGTAVSDLPIGIPACAATILYSWHATKGMNDKYRHCLMGCRINKVCGTAECIAAAYVKEELDAAGMGTPDPADIKATLDGCNCGSPLACSDCDSCCKQLNYRP